MEHEQLIAIAVQTVLFLAGGYALLLRMKDEIKDMKQELHELKQVVIVQAVQTVEITNLKVQHTLLHRTVEELRRGKGWIQGHKGVDGDYEG